MNPPSTLNVNNIKNTDLIKSNQKNARVTTNSGTTVFGKMPRLNARFPEGDIILKLGFVGFFDRQTKQKKGWYGLRHIWDNHQRELGARNARDIVSFIESVLVKKAQIIIDKAKDPDKPLVVEAQTGIVVLELISPTQEEPYYSIITAYSRKSHKGTLMGTL